MIYLNMIVKDESEIIEETLNNLFDHVDIDGAIIHDTGSTDDTIGIIMRFMEDRGKHLIVEKTPWVDFGYNRNLALQSCFKELSPEDYILFFDADDLLHGNKISQSSLDPSVDIYYLGFIESSQTYMRPLLVKCNLNLRWEGVLHEFLVIPSTLSCITLDDLSVESRHIGARHRDPDVYKKDAEILIEASKNPNISTQLKFRYLYKAGDSHFTTGNYETAGDLYSEALELKSITADQMASMYLRLAKCCFSLAKASPKYYAEAEALLLLGYNIQPTRMECAFYLVSHLINQNKVGLAELFLNKMESTSVPSYLVLDELDRGSYRSGSKVKILRFCVDTIKSSTACSETLNSLIFDENTCGCLAGVLLRIAPEINTKECATQLKTLVEYLRSAGLIDFAKQVSTRYLEDTIELKDISIASV